jgi:hypothetical protein
VYKESHKVLLLLSGGATSLYPSNELHGRVVLPHSESVVYLSIVTAGWISYERKDIEEAFNVFSKEKKMK